MTEGSDRASDGEGAPISNREWLKALVLVVVVAVAAVALGIWFVFTFIVQGCGAPACG